MGKANVSFPAGMLEDVDRLADERGITRSAFVQEAVASYIARSQYEQERAERAARIDQARRHMAQIGATLSPGPDGVTLLRQMRDAVPEWARKKDAR